MSKRWGNRHTIGMTLATVVLFAGPAIRAAQTLTGDAFAAELRTLAGV